MKQTLTAFLSSLLLLACGETSGEFVEVPFEARGTPARAFVKGGWEVLLEEAEIGFGPIYFCATESSNSSRCATAQLEYLDGFTVQGLDPNPQSIGLLLGTSGEVNTSFFDYGIVWLLTQPQPEALEGVPGGPANIPPRDPSYVPRGHSGRFVGTATCIADPQICCPDVAECPSEYRFIGNIDVVVATPGTPAVNGAKATQVVGTEPLGLTMQLDPNAWWEVVDYGRLAVLDDGSGTVLLSADQPDYSAVIAAMTSSRLPSFSWVEGSSTD
jgi:hypothetical protein